VSESSQHATDLHTLLPGLSPETCINVARQDYERDKAAAEFDERRQADREMVRPPDAVPGRPQPEPVHFWEVATRAFAAEDFAEAEKRRQLQKRLEQEMGL
jgi:hypothetical protein